MTTVYLNAAYFPGVELLSALATAGILLYGGVQAIHGDVTVGVLVAFVAALNNFFDPIQQLSQLYTTYQAGMAALDKIFELLDEEPDLVDGPTRSSCRGCAARSRSTTSSSPTATGAGALCDIDLTRAARPDRRAGRRDRRRQVDAGQARRALLRPDLGPHPRRRPRPARRGGVLAALADGHRAPGGVPVQRHDRRQHRVRPRRRHAGGGRGRPRARSAPTTSSSRWRTATTPRSASAAPSSPPASASSSRSPAR